MYYVRAKICDSTPQARHVAAWELLYEILWEDFSIGPDDFQWKKTENGRPYSISHPDIYFSLSHTDTCAVCAVSDVPCGIDCEPVGRTVPTLVKEKKLNLPADAPNDQATLMWTKLESYAKMSAQSVFSLDYKNDIESADSVAHQFIDYSDLLDKKVFITLCIRR